MADSTLVFESGSPVEVGSHGSHDHVYVSGTPLFDGGVSTLAFESGIGLGGLWRWRRTSSSGELDGDGNFSHTAGGSPFLDMSHDGSNPSGGGEFGVFWRDDSLASTWELTYTGATYTANNANWQNNYKLGAAATTTTRPFGNVDVASIACANKETTTPEPQTSLETEDGSGTQNNVVVSDIDWSSAHDIVVGYDGTEAYLKIDGSEVARTSTAVVDATYYPTVSLEDDPDVSEGETITVDEVTIT